MRGLTGKVAVVTGGVSGIGRATAVRLAEEGVVVCIADINDTASAPLVEAIRADGGAAEYWHMDVADEQEVNRFFAEISRRYGKLDILFNNAGVPGYPKATHGLTVQEWDRILDIDLKSVFFCTKAAYPLLKRSGAASIINMSSLMGIVGGHDPVFHAAKGGVRMMSKSDACVYAKDNIRVNSIHPGFIATPGAAAHPELLSRELLDSIPLGRTGLSEEIASAVAFLASDEASYITGIELIVDGGYVVR